MAKKTDYKITYIIDLHTEKQTVYVKGDEELRAVTDEMIAKGYYISNVTEWNKYQRRYVQYMKDYKALYNSKQSDRNYFKMNIEERA